MRAEDREGVGWGLRLYAKPGTIERATHDGVFGYDPVRFCECDSAAANGAGGRSVAEPAFSRVLRTRGGGGKEEEEEEGEEGEGEAAHCRVGGAIARGPRCKKAAL